MPRAPIYKKWSVTDDEVLKRLWDKPLSTTAIARRMRRSEATVREKAAGLGLPSKQLGRSRPKRDALPG